MIFYKFQTLEQIRHERNAKECALMMMEFLDELGLREEFIEFLIEKELEKISSDEGKK